MCECVLSVAKKLAAEEHNMGEIFEEATASTTDVLGQLSGLEGVLRRTRWRGSSPSSARRKACEKKARLGRGDGAEGRRGSRGAFRG